MYITFERGRTLTYLILAWILYSVAAVGASSSAPNVQRDLASQENIRFKRDVGSLSTEFQPILPVQVDFGGLADIINQLISGIEGNVTDLGERLKREASTLKEKLEETEEEISSLKMQQESTKRKLASSEASKAKMEEEISGLKMKLKEEISRLREQLKPAGGQKLPTTVEPIRTTQYREKKFVYIGDDADRKNWADAREDCKRRGGDLATHLTEEDLNYVRSELMPKYPVFDPFIGGRAMSQSNIASSFEWLNGDSISADDGLWKVSAFDSLRADWTWCMVIDTDKNLRKDGKKGPSYGKGYCLHLHTYLCEI